MDAANIHLILNHYPMIGSLIGVLVLIVGIWRKSDKVKRAGLWLFLLVALLALPIYATGEIAGKGMAGGMYGDVINEHRESALAAFGVIQLTGIASLIALIFANRSPERARWIVLLVLALSLISSVIVTRTTLKGRQIKWGTPVSEVRLKMNFEDKFKVTLGREKKIWHA